MFTLLHHVGQQLGLRDQQKGEQQGGQHQAAQGGIENFFFILHLGETEIGCLHSVCENDVQESRSGEQDGNVTKIASMITVQQNRGEQVTDEPSEYIAQAKPKGLVRQLFDSSQNITV
jgi:hypothetical protein